MSDEPEILPPEPKTITIPLPEGMTPARREEVANEFRILTNAILVSMGVQELSPLFAQRSAAAISTAAACKQTMTLAEEEAAAKAIKGIKALVKELKAQSEGFKAPLNATRLTIIDLFNKGSEPLEKAAARLRSMLDARELKKRQDAERTMREAEEARQRQEKERKDAEEAAARLQREQEEAASKAEQARREAEKAAKAAEEAKTDKDRAAAEKQAREAAERERKAKDEQARIAAEQEQAAMEAEMAAMLPAPPAPVGIVHASGHSVRMQRDYEIVGRNELEQQVSLQEFVKAGHGFFTNIEPRRAAMLDKLKTNPNAFDGLKCIRVFDKPISSFR